MDFRATSARKFRIKLGIKQFDVFLTKNQSVLTKIMSSFEAENMQTQYNVLGYSIDLYLNKIINKCLLSGDKFVPELHFRQPGFTYSASWPFTKHRKRIQKFRKTGNLKHWYRNELDEVCFAYDAAYSNSKDLAKRTIPDTVLKERAYEVARNPKHDEYQRALASIVYKFFW